MYVDPRRLASRLQEFAGRISEVRESDRYDMEQALLELNRNLVQLATGRTVDIQPRDPGVNSASSIEILSSEPFNREGDQEMLEAIDAAINHLFQGLNAGKGEPSP